MALSKVTYVDGVTIIGAKNLNDIQDELIRQGEQQTEDEESMEAALALKADKSTTYTKTEVDSALALKADKSDTYTKAQVDASLVLKADKSDTYTKAEVDASLELKADKTETYTKAQVDSMIQEAVEEAVKESEYSNFEMKSVGGDFIHITDGAGLIPVKDLKIGIEAVQEGTGDPSPENVRPITGWTGCTITQRGGTIVDSSNILERTSIDNDTGAFISATNYACSNYIDVSNIKSVTVIYDKNTSTSRFFKIARYNANKGFIDFAISTTHSTAGEKRTKVDTSKCAYIAVVLGIVYVDSLIVTKDYNQYLISWQTEAGTVYGGSLDVTTGIGEITYKYFSFTEAVLYGDYQGHPLYYVLIPDIATEPIKQFAKVGDAGDVLCNMFIKTTGLNAQQLGNNETRTNEGNSIDRFYFRCDSISSLADFNAELENNPMVFAAELETPISFTIDPTEVLTLLGENNIFADTGVVEELIYRISRQ